MSDTESEPFESKILTEQGQVVSIDREFAFVQVQAQSGCRGCASSSSCGTSALAGYFKSGSRGLIKVKNSVCADVGDQVQLKLDQSHLIKQAFMAYGIPLLGLFVFALLFQWLGASVFALNENAQEIATIVGGFLGVGFGWFLTHKWYQPVLPEINLMP